MLVSEKSGKYRIAEKNILWAKIGLAHFRSFRFDENADMELWQHGKIWKTWKTWENMPNVDNVFSGP